MELPRSHTPSTERKPKRHSKQTAVKAEYAALITSIEMKVTDLEKGDVCLTWLLDHLRHNRLGACYCKGFGDEVLALKECRQIFRDDVMRLKDEVDAFHNQCEDQMALDKQEVIRNKKKCNKSVNKAKAEMKEKKKALINKEITDEELESEKMYLEKKQRILDREEELLGKEDALIKRRKQLEDYEKEIEEIESYLNKRQEMCDRKHEDLITLNEELKELKTELDLSQNETSERAQRNWEILRRNLQDRQKILESNVQKYRTELASASATITGKDIMINKLQQQISELNQVIESKDQKIHQLESRLAMALTETMKTERGDFYNWRRHQGVGRSQSFQEDSSTICSTDDSNNNSPTRFGLRSASQRPISRYNSVKTNGSIFTNGSLKSRLSREDRLSGGTTFTRALVQQNSSVTDKGEVIPSKNTKSNSSSACTLM